jgi:hypothetical protein
MCTGHKYRIIVSWRIQYAGFQARWKPCAVCTVIRNLSYWVLLLHHWVFLSLLVIWLNTWSKNPNKKVMRIMCSSLKGWGLFCVIMWMWQVSSGKKSWWNNNSYLITLALTLRSNDCSGESLLCWNRNCFGLHMNPLLFMNSIPMCIGEALDFKAQYLWIYN